MYKRLLYLAFLVLILDSCSFVKRIFHRSGSSYYSSSEIKAIVKEAKKFKGVPYKTGGMDKKGMDCSGLLFTSYAVNDLSIPRVSSDQAKFGEEIRLKDVQLGDWVFFATGKVGLINHVGLVTKDQPAISFIHASTTYGVREDLLYQKFWLDRIVKIIRPFKN
jgi:cell wall-associated NlpC family hydrolase